MLAVPFTQHLDFSVSHQTKNLTETVKRIIETPSQVEIPSQLCEKHYYLAGYLLQSAKKASKKRTGDLGAALGELSERGSSDRESALSDESLPTTLQLIEKNIVD